MKIWTVLLVFIICGCTKDNIQDSKVSAQSTDNYQGIWRFDFPATSGVSESIFVKVKTGNFSLVVNKVISSQPRGAVTNLFRQNIGTYSIDGEAVNIKYSYETCFPVGQETMFFQLNSAGQLVVRSSDWSINMTMSKTPNQDSIVFDSVNGSAIEDKNCNPLFVGKENQNRRIPAAAKSRTALNPTR